MKVLLFISALLFFVVNTQSQSIYDIQGQSDASPYNDSTVVTQGIVTAVFPGSYFIQDGDSAWCGIYVYDNSNSPILGDSLMFSALVTEYFDLTELKNVSNYTTLSSGNPIPEPILIATGDVAEKWESVLVRVDSATCTNPDIGFGEWEVNDGTGALIVDNLGDTYNASKDIYYGITGPLNYSFSEFKIAPRNDDDIIMLLALYITEYTKQTSILKNSLNLEFTTNDSAYAIIEYGLTSDLELGTLKSQKKALTHELSIGRLDEAEVYYTKVYAYNENNDTTPEFLSSYATKSSSTGKINVTFVKPSVISTPNTMIDSLVHYISKAKNTLDIAIYDLTNHAPQSDSSNYRIIDAINGAYSSGVAVRLITDDAVANAALDSLNSNITILRGNEGGIMHNKFLLVDRNSINDSWVITGSTNWTYNNLVMDFNNLIAIQDQSLARAYTVEFEEMWGSRTLTPDVSISRFGADKKDNTPHLFDVNGTPMELYFSPSDNTAAHIKSAIDSANTSVDFVMMTFTDNNLGSAINNAHTRGLDVKGIIDYVESSGSEYDYLKESGVDVVDFANEDGSGWPDGATCHHKYAVIDINGAKPLLINGTHNWSASADSKHDENTLLIYNKKTAQKFIEEQELIMNYIDGTLAVKNITSNNITVSPNPSSGSFVIYNAEGQFQTVNIYNISGQRIKEVMLFERTTNVELKNEGLYLLVFEGKNTTTTKKILIM